MLNNYVGSLHADHVVFLLHMIYVGNVYCNIGLFFGILIWHCLLNAGNY